MTTKKDWELIEGSPLKETEGTHVVAWPSLKCVSVYMRGSTEKEVHEAVRLIAAAPEILVAVQRCLNFIEGAEAESGQTLQCGDLARAAIQKATSIGEQ